LLHCDALSVTDGSQGAIVAIKGERFALPSLSVNTVDTIGCGDAYFALSSVAACLDLPASMVALAGSIGAAAMTQRRCNESPVTNRNSSRSEDRHLMATLVTGGCGYAARG